VSSVVRGLALGIAISIGISSCVVKRLMGPRLTGTCEGACDHYLECKHGHADLARCRRECPDVFSDRDSLMAFESLSCQNTIEFVDGRSPKSAAKDSRP
jgi:hypothetical protein